MSVINSIPLIAAGDDDYQISRSVRLRSSASAYFNRTPVSAGNQQKWTWSGWVKFGSFTTGAGVRGASFLFGNIRTSNYTMIGLNPADSGASYQFGIESVVGTAGGSCRLYTTAVLRDPSAWYHLIMAVDTTQATAANRVLIYVNGVQQAITTVFTPAQNLSMYINESGASHGLGATYTSSYGNFDGVMTEVNFIDGQALTPSSFGETDAVTGVWKPKKYAGTYGTNGFYLNFSDPSAATAAAIGKDYSGNGNNWTPNNISVTAGVTYDSMIDVPTPYADGGNGRGNYCTLNPIDSAGASISDGNLKYTLGVGTNYTTRSTIGMTSGKWYAEWTWTSGGNSNVGIATAQASLSQYLGQNAFGWIYYLDGNKYTNGIATAYGATYANGDVIGIAFDADAGTLTFYKNGTSQGVAFTGLTSGPYFFAIGSSSTTGFYNFGQRPFAYTPPTGFKALNTQNLPEPTIVDGGEYFGVSLWTGNQAARTITNSGEFQPDFVWTKSRSDAESHRLHDSVRGGNGSVLYELNSNLTEAEGTDTLVSGFATNGFTIASGANTPNITGRTYVGWQWKAGGTPAVTNTAGSITSTVSAGVTQGFSVVNFTGLNTGGTAATMGHGLGVAPRFIIIKNRDLVDGWYCYHASLGNTAYIVLNTTAAQQTGTNLWSSTSPTSTVFTLRQGNLNTSTSQNLIAYCFAEVPGFSRFGSYTGNGSADGPFVFCGFRPAFVLLKNVSLADTSWIIYDDQRNGFNETEQVLNPNSSAAEATYTTTGVDMLSNGFKLRGASSWHGSSGQTVIFAAFAEHPFKNALAR